MGVPAVGRGCCQGLPGCHDPVPDGSVGTVPDPVLASGAWRLAGRRLGDREGPGGEFCALVLLTADGTLSVSVDDATGATGIGGWRSAGDRRLVAHVELFLRDPTLRGPDRVVVRAAAELSPDGVSASVRLRWRLVARRGGAAGPAVGCEGRAERLQP